MTTKNTRNVLHIPGRLVSTPTNLSSAFPHGGTELGIVRDMVFRFGITTSEVLAEEFGKAPVATFVASERPVFACVLRSYDNDMISTIFHNTAAGSSSGDRVIQGRVSGSGVNRAGYDMMGQAVTLLFSPKAVDRHPHILLYNAVPLVEETAELQMSFPEEFGVAAMFLASPDSQGRTYSIGLREDLSL